MLTLSPLQAHPGSAGIQCINIIFLFFQSAKKQLQKIYYDVKKMKRNKALLSRSVDFSRYAYGQPGKNKCQITLSMPTDSVGYVVTNRMSSTSSLLASNRIDESSASVDSSTNVSLTSNRQTTDMTEYSWEEAGKMSLDILTPLPSERIHYYGSRRRNSSGTDITALTGVSLNLSMCKIDTTSIFIRTQHYISF